MQRLRRAFTAGVVGVLALTTLAIVPVQANNTRTVYFGSAPCPAGAAACPGSTGWAFAYPYGTGGGFSSAGQPIAGQNSFSTVAAGGSTATDIVLANASPSTLTQVQVNAGSQAPTTYNTGSVPLMPSPPTPADSPLINAAGTPVLPSLPGGFSYEAVYTVNNPSAISVSCTLSSSSGSTTQSDGLHCAIGNLAAGQSLTLRIVLGVAATVAVGTYEPWFELGLKEGSSSTGSNSDAFFSYSMLAVGAASCDGATSYFLDRQAVSLSNQTGVVATCPQTTAISSGTTVGGFGTLASAGSRNPVRACPKGLRCFGSESYATVLGGAPVPGGLQWTITWSPLPTSGTPKGVIHELGNYNPNDPSTYVEILFTGKFQCSAKLTTNCWVSNGSITGGFQATVRTPGNGSMRGF